MRWLLCLFILLPLLGKAQEKYLAAYEQKVRLDFSRMKIEAPQKTDIDFRDKDSIPPDIKDSVLKVLSSPSFLEKMLKQQLGEEMVVYMHVRADSSYAELEGHGGIQIQTKMQRKYRDGKWINAKKWTTDFETDTAFLNTKFSFTGNSKQVLGYTCDEMKSSDTAQKITLWVCRTLPPTISPGIKYKNIHWAIFEFKNETNGTRTTLRSIQKIKASI